jgi:uncharacterized repeat protein (TIGR03803 family)
MQNYAAWRFVSALLAAVIFLLIAEPARADVPFAFVFYYGRGGQWATIPIALLIELLVLRLFFEMSWTRAIVADLAMNFASTIVGVGALPFLALIGIVGWSVADIVATIVVAALIDVVIEFGVLRLIFSEGFTWKRGIALFAGNLATAAIITASLLWLSNAVAIFRSTVTGENDGSNPETALIIDAQGSLYGTTRFGGTFDNGVVFRLSPPVGNETEWESATLYSFKGGADGDNPWASLVSDASGALYGTTAGGGASKHGVAFKLTPPADAGKPWTMSTLHSFTGGADGSFPHAPLTFDGGGALYGTTERGGLGSGAVFKLTPSSGGVPPWTLKVLHSFSGAQYVQDSGGSLTFDGNGAVVGTDIFGEGAVFKLTPNDATTPWAVTILHRGGNPVGGVIIDNTGAFFGVTTSPSGSVFKLTPPAGNEKVWTLSTLFEFAGGSERPNGGLIFDKGGALYGTIGGLNCSKPREDCGSVFKLTPPTGKGKPWTMSTLHSFDGSDGANPTTGLISDGSGALYGTTERGGSFGKGVAFRLSPPPANEGLWTLSVLHNFKGRAAGL